MNEPAWDANEPDLVTLSDVDLVSWLDYVSEVHRRAVDEIGARALASSRVRLSADAVPVVKCSSCGQPATYRLGMPTPAWCDAHGPQPTGGPDA